MTPADTARSPGRRLRRRRAPPRAAHARRRGRTAGAEESPVVPPPTLTSRALNRATLARQLLLERAPLGVEDVVGRLVGLQAQVPHDPYTALWSRIEGFDPVALSDALISRRLVRTSRDARDDPPRHRGRRLALRPLVQPVLDAELARHRDFAPLLRGVDLEPVLAYARTALGERPLTGPQLRAALAERFPLHDAAALAYACRCKLALVQVPPRGVWGKAAQVTVATAESWLGKPLDRSATLDEVVFRYFAAFGPATVADVTTWCRLTGLRAVVERLRPRLRDVPGRAGPGALRSRGRAAARSGDARADAVPARVRQRAPLPRRPQPVQARIDVVGGCERTWHRPVRRPRGRPLARRARRTRARDARRRGRWPTHEARHRVHRGAGAPAPAAPRCRCGGAGGPRRAFDRLTRRRLT